MKVRLLVVAFALALTGAAGHAWAQSALDGSSFTLAVARVGASGAPVALDADALSMLLTPARCSCPTNLVVGLALDADAAATLGSDGIQATLVVGNDCSDVSATGCVTVGTMLTLDPNQTSSSETISTADLFAALGAGTSCASLTSTSTRLWAIVRLASTAARVPNPPSLALGGGGSALQAPTAVTVQTANQGLQVSWTASASTAVGGYQVLCSPGPATPSAPAFDSCAAAAPAGDGGTFAALDPTLLCSGLVTGSSVRVGGLDNGRAYQVAVIAIGQDGFPSAPSAAVQGTPGPTLGFDDIYKENGGQAQAGCSVAPHPGTVPAAKITIVLAALVLLWRRRRRRLARLIAAVVVLASVPAHAQEEGILAPVTWTESPRNWNFELRFGPYRPDIDSEFADRGSPARPFEETFGSSHRLMTQLELDRHILHRNGTLALGLSAGLYRASAKALTPDEQMRTGDDTSLRLVPLSVSLVYRADQLYRTRRFPLIPYVKAGLDSTIWTMSDSAKSSSTSGVTYGWHAAGGLSLALNFLDPESARSLDQEAGVNQTAIFFEVAHYALDGLGSGSQLRVGDTTWLAGLMLEL